MTSVSKFTFLVLYCFSVALAQDDDYFIYKGFSNSNLQRSGAFVHRNGLLQLTKAESGSAGYAFHRLPIKFNTSSVMSASFSSNFVFAMVSKVLNLEGFAFVISSMDFSKVNESMYATLFEASAADHTLMVQLDSAVSIMDDSNNSAIITVPPVSETDHLSLMNGEPLQMRIGCNGVDRSCIVNFGKVGTSDPYSEVKFINASLSQILLDTIHVGFWAANSGNLLTDHYILGWSFNRTGTAQDLDIKDLPSVPKRHHDKRKFNLTALVSVVAAVLVVVTIGGALHLVWKKRYDEVYEDWEREYGPQRFSYKDLLKATNDFGDKEVIGKGGFGKVYRGVLTNLKVEIAVKRISHDSKQGMKEFIAEIASMGRLRHRNLVQLRGYCRRRGELLLVYDYMQNGSLDRFLYSKNKPQLGWSQRFRIIKGVASGLLYLHEEWEQVVLHRDIKPGNVLLDADLNGKLGDFGLARLYDRDSNPQTTKLVGTIGYMAPELLTIEKASTSTDVYAFGVFMLEVASGKRPRELRRHVIDCWTSGAILDAADARLEGAYTEDQMEVVLKLGLFCSHSNPATRPNMRQVMQFLDGDVLLPDILPDQVIDFFSATDQSWDNISFNPLSEYNSTVESILGEGR